MMTFCEPVEILPSNRMKTLADRVRWVLANRPGFRNQTELARRSGLSEGFFGPAKSRESQDPEFVISLESAKAVAEVAKVDAKWFQTGEGVPDAAFAANYDTHEMRRWAALLAAQIEEVPPEKAFWVIGGIELDEPSKEGFLLEGIKRLRAGDTPPAELTEDKIRTYTAQFTRRAKGH